MLLSLTDVLPGCSRMVLFRRDVLLWFILQPSLPIRWGLQAWSQLQSNDSTTPAKLALIYINSTLICFFKIWAPCYEIEINISIILTYCERSITLNQSTTTSAQCEGWPHLFSRRKVLMAQRAVVCHIFWFGSWNCLKNNVRIANRG